MTDLFDIYFKFWIFSIPISCLILYFLLREILDIVFNGSKIDNLLKKSDSINVDFLYYEYEKQKKKQLALEKSTLLQMERQIKYKRERGVNGNAKTAKELSDTFKIK